MLKFILPFFLTLFALSTSAQQEGQNILKKHFAEAGQDLWNQINNLTIDGRWVDENYYGHNIKLTFKTPDKIRIQGKFKQKTFIEAFNGTYGWIVAPWKNKYEAQQMNAEEELLIRNSFSLGSPLYKHRDKLSYEGLRDLEGTVYNSFVYEDDRIKKTYYLDRDDHKLYFEKIESKTDQIEILKIYEKYRTYNGLSLPAAVRFEGDDLDKELVFDQVYIGLGAADTIFEAPGG